MRGWRLRKFAYIRRYIVPRNNKAPSCERGQVLDLDGAGERSRTLDLLITNELLYQLSYTGESIEL